MYSVPGLSRAALAHERLSLSVLRWGALSVVFLLPLLFVDLTIEFTDIKIVAFQLAAAFLGVVLAIRTARTGTLAALRTPPAVPAVLFVVTLWSLARFNEHSQLAAELEVRRSALFLVFFAVVCEVADRRFPRQAALAVTGSGVVLSVYGLLNAPPVLASMKRWFPELVARVLPEGLVQQRVSSLAGHPSLLSGVLVVSAPLALGLLGGAVLRAGASTRGSPARRWAYFEIASLFVSLVTMFLALVMSLSRGGYVAMAAGMGAFGFLAVPLVFRRGGGAGWSPRETLLLRRVVAAAVVVVALLSIAVGAWYVARARKKESHELERMVTYRTSAPINTFRLRQLSWRTAFDAISENPVFGTGVGTFTDTYPRYQSLEFADLTVQSAKYLRNLHSEFYQVFWETGFLGAGLLLLVYGRVLLSGFRAVCGARGPRDTLLLLGVLAGVVGALTLSAVSISFRFTMSPALFWLAAGILVMGEHGPANALDAASAPRPDPAPAARVAAAFCVSLLLVLAGWHSARWFAAECRSQRARLRYELSRAFPRRSAERLRQARALALQALALEPRLVLARYTAGLSAFRMRRYAEAADHFEQASRQAPGFPNVNTNLGLAYWNLDKLALCLNSLRRELELNPYQFQVYKQMGSAYHRKAEFELALSAYDTYRRSHPTDAGVLNDMGIVYLENGRLRSAWAFFNQGLRYEPFNERLRYNMAHLEMIFERPGEAADHLVRAIDNLMDDPLYRMRTAPGGAGERKALRFVVRGADLRSMEKNRSFIEDLPARAIKKAPRSERARRCRYGLAVLKFLTGELDAAAKDFDALLKETPREEVAYPDRARILFYRGQIAIRKDDMDAARRFFEAVREIYPDQRASIALLADIAARQGKPERRKRLLQQLRAARRRRSGMAPSRR